MSPMNYLSLLLVVATFISYIPQYQRMLTLSSSAGLSIASVLIITLMNQVQTVTMYYLFKTAPDMRYGIPIATPPSIRDWLNLSQILVQWSCSLFLFALVIYLPSPTISPTAKRVAVGLWIFHGLFSIFYIVVGGRPEDIVFNINRNLHVSIVNPLFIFLAVVAFYLQARIIPPVNKPGAYSEWTLGTQLFIFMLLAVSWPFRLILPLNMWELGPQAAIFLGWYPWVGWACINTTILTFDRGILLLLCIRTARFNGEFGSHDEHEGLIRPREL
ncbi:uncharacterized protein EAF02_011924 [Botrytis sinoallii]|uniref:uncharacterized protein n=1 Tax=Botrytis sinoallii TaxID=1463999 RepID=UPI0018FF2DBA|nr:uncharacterized protein EAF02_011924 [Botrytis sinoallii]KAF7853619.1 hypothetical protein EAF02_011924 [Botrytis sinoallii]